MSVLLEIKSLVLRGLKNEDPRIKMEAIKVFNAIDTDLDAVEYNPSESEEDSACMVISAIEDLNKAFVDVGIDIDTLSEEIPEQRPLKESELGDEPTDES